MIPLSGMDTAPGLNPLAKTFVPAEPIPAADADESPEHVADGQAEVDEWGNEWYPARAWADDGGL